MLISGYTPLRNLRQKVRVVRGKKSVSVRVFQSNAHVVRTKNPKIQIFFNCFVDNNLILILSEVEGQISHQMRKFALIRGARFFTKHYENSESQVRIFTLYSSCLGVFVAETRSIKNNKLCKTKPISRLLKWT